MVRPLYGKEMLPKEVPKGLVMSRLRPSSRVSHDCWWWDGSVYTRVKKSEQGALVRDVEESTGLSCFKLRTNRQHVIASARVVSTKDGKKFTPVWFKDTVKLNLQTILSVSGTTGRALAFGTGMAETTISDFRRGRITPSLFAANEIAEHFGIPIDFLSQTEPAKIVDVCLVRVWQEPEGDLRHFLQKLARSFFQELAQDESEKMLALEAALFPDDAWLSSPEGESHE